MVLFETPSGFAIFYADGISLYEPDAMEVRALFFFLASLLMCFVTFFLLALVVVDLPFLDPHSPAEFMGKLRQEK